MRIVKHIEKLLLGVDSVIVPALGCFMAHNIPARFDGKEGIFLPPTRTLGFNPLVTINDSMLVQSYIEAYTMSYPDALKEIEREVVEIKAALTQDGVFRFDGVGTLRYNNKEYDFTPSTSGLLTPVLYGMGALEIEPVMKTAFNKQGGEEPYVITIQRKTVRRITNAAAVIAIAVLSVIPMKYAADNIDKIQMASVVNVEDKEVKEVKEIKEVKVSKVVKDSKPPKLFKAPQAENSRFTIVLASGISAEGAVAYTDSLKREGIDASISDGKYPQVVYGTYATADDARNEIAKHATHPRFSVAWVKKN